MWSIRKVERKTGNVAARSTADLMNAELKMVLESFRRQRPHLEIVKTPDVYVSQKSSPGEVQSWLKIKGFSPRIMKQFDGVNGDSMFSLSKSKLEEYCGDKEGLRLYSQITVQRNVSGFKTARSSELRQILAKQRNKVDSDATDKAQTVEEDFGFLEDYDKSGYQTDSESEEESAASGGNPGTNTLKEQIKKQRKKIINQTFDEKASR
ncbi:Epidermal growth factor receptor kinase substrate 8 [Chionoecetes opilio]|uniref:Epidermal growth factor receptor kinase substrate 8 n=1 Tax=Chionoecetes opilio TaxID=41210 RepID=A0A8J5CGV5_CHIOP|nr:Epidermal growth factor receptor kinase substrate 8 [Chionoecetes opilio]